jgi:hypothetical protein
MRWYQSLSKLSHSMARAPALRIAGVTALVLIASCKPEEALPGTALGSFAVTAVLSSNTCGDGLNPTNPWKFDADMSLDGNTLHFRATDEEEISAPLDSENTATCTTVVNSQPSTDSACTLSLKTIYTIKLDSATAPKTSSGSLRFEHSASGSNKCAGQLSANGGTYDELPCAVEYSYTALKE